MRITQYPNPLLGTLQDVCIELDAEDATLLPGAARKLLRVVGAVPRMEAFIGQVKGGKTIQITFCGRNFK